MAQVVFRFRIALKDVEPEVWRRIQVPAPYSFWDLHVAIQDAMGWLDYHLHLFRVTDRSSSQPVEIGIPMDDDFSTPCLAGWETAVGDYFLEPGDEASYAYDFGDGWEHSVVLEEVAFIREGLPTLLCLGGKGACPPEDCGGPPGYLHLLDVLSSPEHPEHSELREWVGGKFNPTRFSASRVKLDDPDERWKKAFKGS